jgi:hypothetical protein
MLKSLTFSIALLSSISTFSKPAVDTRDLGKKATKRVNEVKNAVKAIDILGGHCTIFKVGNDGTYLTALHCLRRCFKDQSLLEEGSLYDESVTRIKPTEKNVICTSKFKKEKDYRISTDFEVLFTGSQGWISDKSKTKLMTNGNWQKIYQLEKIGFTGRGSMGDFALIKDLNHNTDNKSCLKLSGDIKANSKAWTYKFPLILRDRRYPGDNPMTAVFTPTYSEGVLTESITNWELFDNYLDDQKEALIKFYDRNTFNISSVETSNGSSGGPLFDDSNEVIGVNIATVQTRMAIYEYGSSVSIRADYINYILKKNNIQLSCEK